MASSLMTEPQQQAAPRRPEVPGPARPAPAWICDGVRQVIADHLAPIDALHRQCDPTVSDGDRLGRTRGYFEDTVRRAKALAGEATATIEHGGDLAALSNAVGMASDRLSVLAAKCEFTAPADGPGETSKLTAMVRKLANVVAFFNDRLLTEIERLP